MDSLYIHFPFCETRCHYCDFYSISHAKTRPSDPQAFESALQKEIQYQAPLLCPTLDTIFLGGGTPSMTSYDSMSRALDPLWKLTSITSKTEWTMEANPSSLTLSSLKQFRTLGINRISLGIQTLQPAALKALGRAHSKEQALQALGSIFHAGFENVSVDLLCGIPDQSTSDLEESLKLLLNFPITHLSCYLLTLAPHHKMYHALPSEDIQLSQLLFIDQCLTEQGFEHYEISNFSRKGKKARHNLKYWKGASYLGLGPSAHSFDSNQPCRWKNVSSLHKYCQLLKDQTSPIESKEELSPQQLEIEKWMLALRLNEGFPKHWLSTPFQKKQSEIFKEKGLLEKHPTLSENLRLTPHGFTVSDQIMNVFI